MNTWGAMSLLRICANSLLRCANRIVLAFFLFVVTFNIAHGATLSFDPDHGNFAPGETFMVAVRIDLDPEECMNAGMVEIQYPKDALKAVVVASGESVLTLWTEEPTVDQERGVVTFSGGVPAGYCGRIDGDPGKTNTLAKIGLVMSERALGGGVLPQLTFSPNTQVLLNDGLGTPATLTQKQATYTATPGSGVPANEWLDIVHEDTIPPEVFSVSRIQDEKAFQGKHFIVFATVDKQTGVHHYEVTEDDPQRYGMVRGKKTERALPLTVTSPYELRDQELRSRIIVRAFDHAGNVQETILPPLYDERTTDIAKSGDARSWAIVAVGFAILLALSCVAVIVYRRKSTHTQGGGGPGGV